MMRLAHLSGSLAGSSSHGRRLLQVAGVPRLGVPLWQAAQASRSCAFASSSAGKSNNSKGAASQEALKPFDKILIANRGEIACRVIKTCRRLGVKTVAVYSDADAASMHVRMADEAFCIGTALSKDSYLRMDRILEVAKKTGAQGIHPGYGFLSENAKFVDMVEAEGIVFIGPSSAPMNAMGDKINSKRVAKAANCFIIPGFEGEVEDAEHAVKLAKEVGYPVMIKASAGGGGKGMRVAYNDEEVREGFRLSKAEALSSFGDDRMLIERFIEDPHHIEIQVLADTHGNVVAFPERECSVQRRNQKVVEESPSCLLSAATRKAMQQQAIALCKATGYRSAGTVEMLADGKQNFFFLEMNTRLQVEHPITELVSGEDLVEHMLWIAAGKKLPDRLTKNPCLSAKGWALESRVYAEDPLRNFLPSIGPLVTYKEPHVFSPINDNVNSDQDAETSSFSSHAKHPDGTVRIDTGVFEGGTISMYYDPMIAKLCTHAPTRKEAIELMEGALDRYVVQGLGNNLCFLRSVYRNKAFRDGKYGTKFIPEQYPDGFKGVQLSAAETNDLIAAAVTIHRARAENSAYNDYDYQPDEPDDLIVIVGGVNGKAFRVTVDADEATHVNITPLEKEKAASDKAPMTIVVNSLDWQVESPLAYVSCQQSQNQSRGKKQSESSEESERSFDVQYEGRTAAGDGYRLRVYGSQQEVVVRTPREHELNRHMLPPEVKDMSRFLLCPMPGTLVSLAVTPGQRVEAGQQLAVVEAMKMQNVLRAEKAGTVKNVLSAAGAHLKVDQKIVEFEV